MTQVKDETAAAAMVRNAVDELNKALAEAARCNLIVTMDSVTLQNVLQEARQVYTAKILKRL